MGAQHDRLLPGSNLRAIVSAAQSGRCRARSLRGGVTLLQDCQAPDRRTPAREGLFRRLPQRVSLPPTDSVRQRISFPASALDRARPPRIPEPRAAPGPCPASPRILSRSSGVRTSAINAWVLIRISAIRFRSSVSRRLASWSPRPAPSTRSDPNQCLRLRRPRPGPPSAESP